MLYSVCKKKADGDVILSVQNIKAGYRQRFFLEGITFSLKKGTFLGVLGPNGSGKTTLLRAITGTLPIYSGTVELCGKPVNRYSGKSKATIMGVLPQDTVIQFPFTCGDVIWMGRYPHRKKFTSISDRDVEVVEWAMEITEVKALKNRLITEVSGGERQRVLLARVLAQATPLMLLDEPTSAMDIQWTLKSLSLLSGLCHTKGVTVMAIMHDINMALMFCDEIMLLKNGHMIAYGSADEVISPDILEMVYNTKARVIKLDWLRRPQVIFPPEPYCYDFGCGTESSKNSGRANS